MTRHAATLVLLALLATPAAGQALTDAELDKRLAGRTVDLPSGPRPIPELLARLSRALGADVHLDGNARSHLAEKGWLGRFALPLKGAALGDALGLLVELTGLRTVRHGGRLVITTAEAAASFEPSQTRIYRIADLDRDEGTPEPPALPDLRALLGRSSARFSEDEESAPTITKEALVEMIKSSIDPNSWEEGNNSIDAVGGRLVVVASPRIQRRVGPFIARVRALRTPRVTVEAWWTTGAAPAEPVPLAAWRTRAGAPSLITTGPLQHPLALHSGREVRRAGKDGPVRLAVGLTLIATAAPGPRGSTRVELELQDSALTDDDGRGPGLRRLRVGQTVTVPANHAVPVLSGGRAGAGRVLVLAARRTTPPAGAVPPVSTDPRAGALRATIERVRHDWRFDDAPLTTLAAELADVLKIPVVVDPELLGEQAIGTVRLDLRAATADELLDVVNRDLGVGWLVRHGALLLTSPLKAAERSVTVFRDVRDIDIAGGFDPSARWRRRDPGAEEAYESVGIDAIMNLIRDNVAKDSWEGENTVRSRDGILWLRNTPTALRQIDALLARLRQRARPDVSIEIVARAGTRELARVLLRAIDGADVAWRDGEQRYDRTRDVLSVKGDLRIATRATLVEGESVARLRLQVVVPGPRPLRWYTELELPLGKQTPVGGVRGGDGIALFATVRRLP